MNKKNIKTEQPEPLDSKDRNALIARIKSEIASSSYRVKSVEIAEKIGQVIKDDLPVIQIMKGFNK